MLFEAHEDGLERPRLQPRFAAQLVTVAPAGWALDEPFQHEESLRICAGRPASAVTSLRLATSLRADLWRMIVRVKAHPEG